MTASGLGSVMMNAPPPSHATIGVRLLERAAEGLNHLFVLEECRLYANTVES